MNKRDGHIDKEEKPRDTTGEIKRETRRKPDDETTTNAHVQEEDVDSLQGQDITCRQAMPVRGSRLSDKPERSRCSSLLQASRSL